MFIRLYPLEYLEYPTNRNSWLWSSKSFLVSVEILAQAFEPKNPEMRHIRLVSTLIFERSDSIKMLVRNHIFYVGCIFYSFIPKNWCKSLRLHHTSVHLVERSIFPLSNTILLRCVGKIMFHLDTCIFTIMDELRLDILTTITRSEDLEFPPRLVKNLRLMF